MHDNTKGKKYILDYEKLQAGDIILESGKAIHSKGIQISTKSHFSHAMICVENVSIIHAEKEGIFSKNLQRLLVEEINDLKVLRLKKSLSINEQNNLVTFLRMQVGSLYSVKDAIKVVKYNTSEQETKNELQFCSRLVAQAYNHIGYNLVNNVDFCSPGDIERSELLFEVEDIVKKATKEELQLASTKDVPYENLKSTYRWLTKARKLAATYKYNDIHTQTDVPNFLIKHPEADEQICSFLKESGFLDDYKIEMKTNPVMYSSTLFIEKYKDISSLTYAVHNEYEITLYPIQRFIQDYKASLNNYHYTNLQYYKLHTDLYKNILQTFILKYKTLIEVCDYILRVNLTTQSDQKPDMQLMFFLMQLDNYSSELKKIIE